MVNSTFSVVDLVIALLQEFDKYTQDVIAQELYAFYFNSLYVYFDYLSLFKNHIGFSRT